MEKSSAEAFSGIDALNVASVCSLLDLNVPFAWEQFQVEHATFIGIRRKMPVWPSGALEFEFNASDWFSRLTVDNLLFPVTITVARRL